jgi:hypothetical protein
MTRPLPDFLPRAVVHFATPPDADQHFARCTACKWRTTPERGCNAPRSAKRRALKHCTETGHEVRIDVTRQHGYRPAKD